MFDEILNAKADEPTAPELNLEHLQKGHRIVFLKGRAKNFRSIGNNFIEIDYVKNRSTLVISDENGAGKSTTTVWLIYYAITGQPYYKKDKVTSLVNSTTRKNMLVELELMIRGTVYKIVRGRKPDVFELYALVDDKWKQYKADAAKDDLQNHIWSLLGLEPKSGAKIIENACVLGRERFAPFLEMSAEDRRLLVESVWDLKIFRNMSDIAKSKRGELNEKIREVSKVIEIKQSKISSAKDFYEKSSERVTELEQREYDAQREINRLKSEKEEKVQELTKTINELSESGDQAVMGEIKRIETQIFEIESEKKELGKKFENELQRYFQQAEEKTSEVGGKISTLKSEIEALNNEISELETELEEYRTQETSIRDRLTSVQQDLEDSNQKLQKVMGFKPEVEFNERNARERLQKFEEMGECPQCEQRVGEDKVEQIRSEVQPVIEKAQADKAKLEKAITEQQNRNTAARVQVSKIQNELATVKNEIEERQRKLSQAQNEKVRKESDLKVVEESATNIPSREKILEGVNEKRQAQEREIDANIRDLKFKITQLQEGADKRLVGARNDLENVGKEYATLIESVETRKTEILGDIEGNKADLQVQEEKIQELEKEYTELNNESEQHHKDLAEYEYIIEILGDKEGKADVVRMYLPYLNAKINEYLEAMNLFVALEIDEQFNATMENPSRKGQTLFSLSTGQRARINLAIMFALRDVANLKASFHTNLFVLDEVLENLSERGVVEAIGMIKEKFTDANVFLITQRNDEFSEHFENQLFYELRGDETYQVTK